MLFPVRPPDDEGLEGSALSARNALRAAYRMDEAACVRERGERARLTAAEKIATDRLARELVTAVRARRAFGIEAFLREYGLDTREGIVLLCVAEALLRIPDNATADRLIRDKVGGAEWDRHLGQSPSLFVNASTWGLMLTGRVVRFEPDDGAVRRLVGRAGEPVVRAALLQAMKILGHQFVLGRDIREAMSHAAPDEKKGVRFSYDMLGEGARTEDDAQRYLKRYAEAIAALGANARGATIADRPGISVKLSALHPRYEFAKRRRLHNELLPRIVELAALARTHNVGLCIDAEEADRLEPSLDLIERLAYDPALAGWDGLGLAAQAYQKRGLPLIAWLEDLARRTKRRLMVRLVKGAYWDTEIKRAQESGVEGYPVFTRKVATDVSYLACARALFAAGDRLYPQFATHNAHTVAAVLAFASARTDFEFQRLHGMGEALYEELRARKQVSVRVYAPVGAHEDLLPYLVRRLLENGANTSFVNRIHDEKEPIERLIADPMDHVAQLKTIPHPRIPLPRDLYAPERANARGLDLTDPEHIARLRQQLPEKHDWHSAPIVAGKRVEGQGRAVTNPATGETIGTAIPATAATVDRAITIAHGAAETWDRTPASQRAAALRRAADALETAMPELLSLCVLEGGRIFPDAVAEVREAVDFLRYYAARAEELFARPRPLPGPTGEKNELWLHGRGVFACISPWNFPLSIFVGQVAAALAAGNAVLAKPAEQTTLIACRAVELLHASGVPTDVLQFVPGPGREVGARLVADPRVAGVNLTGSTETAAGIHKSLASRPGPIGVLLAETGGLNAMIADSSALTEQLVDDAVLSAFDSAGQRCSALRLLFVQDEVADKTLTMLAGAMAELAVGDPRWLATDVGPVIDAVARDMLLRHIEEMRRSQRVVFQTPFAAESGTFVPPTLVELDSPGALQKEVFGPILHVVRFAAGRLDQVCEAINASGYGLTLGVHSRIDEVVNEVRTRTKVGNLYVNRSIIGAVVGVQPFGGEGLSGTGPKAGGPYTLLRYATERVTSVDTTAAGGNASLFAVAGEEER
jgi:RHH-type proline utilization regulon transcriptional repressor/proline dehydrogenase/delta 1-pyrroline-5-carboxylate dehydrogenase